MCKCFSSCFVEMNFKEIANITRIKSSERVIIRDPKIYTIGFFLQTRLKWKETPSPPVVFYRNAKIRSYRFRASDFRQKISLNRNENINKGAPYDSSFNCIQLMSCWSQCAVFLTKILDEKCDRLRSGLYV